MRLFSNILVRLEILSEIQAIDQFKKGKSISREYQNIERRLMRCCHVRNCKNYQEKSSYDWCDCERTIETEAPL